MNPQRLIETARHLATIEGRRPRQSDLCRAVSTVYYALFHALCRNCADTMIGATPAHRHELAWRQAYRTLNHSQAKERLGDRTAMNGFPSEVQDFGSLFVDAQERRHSADYDPSYRVSRLAVLNYIAAAEDAIDKLESVNTMDRRALAAWVALQHRGRRR